MAMHSMVALLAKGANIYVAQSHFGDRVKCPCRKFRDGSKRLLGVRKMLGLESRTPRLLAQEDSHNNACDREGQESVCARYPSKCCVGGEGGHTVRAGLGLLPYDLPRDTVVNRLLNICANPAPHTTPAGLCIAEDVLTLPPNETRRDALRIHTLRLCAHDLGKGDE